VKAKTASGGLPSGRGMARPLARETHSPVAIDLVSASIFRNA
jgi:hypothetical protein